MAVTVEDGSIVSGADSYATEAELISYAAARGVTVPDAATATPLLIKAMERLNGLAYIGERYSRDQALDWPRSCVYVDGFYYAPAELPPQLKQSQLALALAANSADLMPVAEVGAQGAKIEETIGPITDRFAEPVTRTRALVPVADQLLAKLLRGSGGIPIIRA